MRLRLLPMAWALLLLFLTSPVSAETPWKWEAKTLDVSGDGYHFEWSYPKLTAGPGDTANWQKLLDRKVADWANEFQNDYEDSWKENRKIRQENPDYKPAPWGSEGAYQVVWQDERRLILLWQGYDYRGGAHGAHFLEVTILDAEQPDSLLPPSSLFTDEREVLRTLSEVTRSKLEEHFGEKLDEWALKGSEPKWENFTIVYPNNSAGQARFEVIFPSYQVAPYAAGTPSVEFPFEVLAPWAPTLLEGTGVPRP